MFIIARQSLSQHSCAFKSVMWCTHLLLMPCVVLYCTKLH